MRLGKKGVRLPELTGTSPSFFVFRILFNSYSERKEVTKMTNEHRGLIRKECDKIVDEHDRLSIEAREKGDAIEACCHTYAAKGALELMLAILQLDKDEKI
ncbi:MAG: hypothetical protein LIR46_12735 [Bacteroidota bacterium]|nr:hypothetical protein [Bacteroidota bacterium]